MARLLTRLQRLSLAATIAGGVTLVALLIFVTWLAAPLFYNRTVDEPFPAAVATSTSVAIKSTAAMQPQPTAAALAAKPTAAMQPQPTAAALAAKPTAAMQPQSTAAALVPTVVPSAVPTVVPSAVPTAVPSAVPTVVPSAVPTVVPSGPVVLRTGNFVAGKVRGDEASGAATFYKLEDGRTVLRLEAFSATNGPDLVVALSAAADPVAAGFKSAAYATLAPLKGNRGNQTYELPADLDLGTYQSVVIWCRAFDVVFGYAPLS